MSQLASRIPSTAIFATVAILTACAAQRQAPPSALLQPESTALEAQAPERFQVQLGTSQGAVVVTVHRDWAPYGADRFYYLVVNGFFDGERFFRVRAKFIAQFGLNGDPAVIAAWKERGEASVLENKDSWTPAEIGI